MKKSVRNILIFSVLAIGVAWWFLPNSWERKQSMLPKPQPQESSPPAESVGGLKRREELLSLLKANNAAIEFHGMVEDESGNPLEDVDVTFSIVMSGSFAPSLGLPAGASGKVTTGKMGRFEIAGQTGVTLRIESLEKPGYHEVKRNSRTFGYGDSARPHVPDAEAPVLFVLAKGSKLRSLTKRIPLRFDWDGNPVSVSISFPSLKETLIIVPRSAKPQPGVREYPWEVELRIEGGETALGRVGEPSIAPDDGYAESITLEGRIDAAYWSNTADALLYAKTASGDYLQLRFIGYSGRTSKEPTASIVVAYNPSGGRVFE